MTLRVLFLSRLALAAIMFAMANISAHAHKLDPAFLEVTTLSPDSYSVTFKIPQASGKPLPLTAVLPQNCNPRQSNDLTSIGNAFIARWVATCEGGLANRDLFVDGLDQTGTDVLVRIQLPEDESLTALITADSPRYTVQENPSFWDVAKTYTQLGITHILFGIDHILFVFGLILLVRGPVMLIKTITAFTIAHSITLSAAVLEVVHVPGPPVEAIIALSIVFIAVELIKQGQGTPRLSERMPWLVAFAFGLLHGFGFAGALSETGLPQSDIPAALLTFNIGVEIGQLLFVAAVFAIRWSGCFLLSKMGMEQQHQRAARTVMIYAIGVLASYWLWDRMVTVIA